MGLPIRLKMCMKLHREQSAVRSKANVTAGHVAMITEAIVTIRGISAELIVESQQHYRIQDIGAYSNGMFWQAPGKTVGPNNPQSMAHFVEGKLIIA